MFIKISDKSQETRRGMVKQDASLHPPTAKSQNACRRRNTGTSAV